MLSLSVDSIYGIMRCINLSGTEHDVSEGLEVRSHCGHWRCTVVWTEV